MSQLFLRRPFILPITALASLLPLHAAEGGITSSNTSGDPASTNFWVGATGDGSYAVDGGSDASFIYNLIIAAAGGHTATVTVDGAGSTVTVGSGLNVGQFGAGVVSVTNGGEITSQTGLLGWNAGATGQVTIDGSDSQWTVGSLTVGQQGDGTLSIQNGGVVNAAAVMVGQGAGITGDVTVDGSGSAFTATTGTIGDAGDATVAITGGATATFTGAVTIGGGTGDGDVTVDGAGSKLVVGDALTVGDSGSSSLSIEDGGVVTAASAIIEAGGAIVLDDGTLTTTGGLVSAGTLSGQGTINGSVTLDADAVGGTTADLIFNGMVSGSGNITGRVRFNGGYSPGNSPAKVTLGSPTFGAGNTLTMEVGGTTPGTQYDQIVVTGTAKLGGTLDVDLINSFTPDAADTFELITTTGSGTLTGAFATIDVPTLDGMVFRTTTNGDRVLLWLEAVGDFNGIDVALTGGDTQTQGAINRVIAHGTSNAALAQLAQDIAVLPTEEQQREALHAISGHTARQTFALGAGATKAGFANVRSRMQPSRDGVGSEVRVGTFSDAWSPDFEDAQLASYLNGPGAEPSGGRADIGAFPVNDETWGVFAIGGYTHARQGATANQSAFDTDQLDLTIGIDRWLANDKTRVGAALGYVTSESDNRDGSGGSEADVLSLIAFASHDLRDDLRLVGSVSYGYADYDLSRRVAFPGFDETAEADTHGHMLAGELGVIYHREWRGIELLPQAYLQYVGERLDGYEESGAGAANLAVEDQTRHSLVSSLIFEVAKRIDVGRVSLRPSAHIGWEHQFLDDGETVGTSFVGDPSIRFDTLTDGSVRDAMTFGVGVSCAASERVSLYVDYEGRVGEQDSESHRVEAGLRLTF